MDTHAGDFDRTSVLDAPLALDALSRRVRDRAAGVDARAEFPAEDFADLRAGGWLAAPLPRRFGGQGFGTEPQGAAGVLAVLSALGRGSIATGRLFEAHVNALKLVSLYGSEEQMARVAADVHAGHAFGLWVTEVPPGLTLRNRLLHGQKSICSGAGHVSRALVTAQGGDADPVMALVSLQAGERVVPGTWHLAGVRGAVTAAVDFSGLAADVVGRPGDYLRQPEFSAGAWRTSAVTLGAMQALSACVRATLVARGRAENPHQQVRIGKIRIAEETAHLWMQRVAPIAEGQAHAAGDVAAVVNLARMAVEAAALDIIALAQRALGLPAFIAGTEAERLMRDLATYLRQPAPDETLTEAAAWFMTRDLPC
jgi:alkylation response protein AidB-like acyl-CoA dehydrogenase